jgi:hypothetical protein
MSQRDNVFNKKIGEQSLKVTHHGLVASANMHTIAVVTLLFLPGTFVAVSQSTLSSSTMSLIVVDPFQYWLL